MTKNKRRLIIVKQIEKVNEWFQQLHTWMGRESAGRKMHERQSTHFTSMSHRECRFENRCLWDIVVFGARLVNSGPHIAHSSMDHKIVGNRVRRASDLCAEKIAEMHGTPTRILSIQPCEHFPYWQNTGLSFESFDRTGNTDTWTWDIRPAVSVFATDFAKHEMGTPILGHFWNNHKISHWFCHGRP